VAAERTDKPLLAETPAPPDGNGAERRGTGTSQSLPARDIYLERRDRVAKAWNVPTDALRPCIANIFEAGMEKAETGLFILGLEMGDLGITDPRTRRRLLNDYNSRNITPASPSEVERHANRRPRPQDGTYGCKRLKLFCTGYECPLRGRGRAWLQARMDPTNWL